MKKIDLTNVQEYADFKRPVGGFVLKVIGAEDVADKEYLRISYDIVQAYDPEDAEFVGMYAKRKAERGFDYPSTVVSYKETALPMFKGFVTALKESNNGYDFTATYNEAELVGKVFGAVLGDEEYNGKDKNGAPKVKVRTTVVVRKSVESILKGDFTIPELKKLDQTPKSTPNPFQQAAQTVSTPTPTQPQETPNPFANVGNMAPAPTPMPAEQPTDNTLSSDEVPF